MKARRLNAVCYKMTARYLKFKPQDGIAVLARGRIDMYDARGEVQFVVEAIEPQGHGALQLAFEQLKKKLAAEGLFDHARKRPLPALPERIGIVTSPSGAVIRDMLHILERRFPGRHIRIYPAQVQGEGATEQVAAGIEYFSRSGWAEVVIVARGGGRWKICGRSMRSAWRAPSRLARAGDFGNRARDRLHHRRFRGGSSRAHAFGGRRTGDRRRARAYWKDCPERKADCARRLG